LEVGNNAADFGSMENLLLALFVLVVILFFKHWTKGFLSSSSILFGIIAGYIAAIIMGLVLPRTGITADGVGIYQSLGAELGQGERCFLVCDSTAHACKTGV